jgi:hypothetical protein
MKEVMHIVDEVNQQNETPDPKDTSTPAPVKTKETKAPTNKPVRWQERLLPLMSGMLIALTVFFFLVTLFQISYLHWSIFRSPPVELDSATKQALLASTNRFEDLYTARQFEIRAELESYIIEKRYHQISVQLMSGIWLRYLGFITGMILALIGAAFILGKLRVSEQELEGKSSGFSISLRTTSPGIFLAVLGAILMFTTLIDRDAYNVKDANVYLSIAAPALTAELGKGSDLQQLPGFYDDSNAPETMQPTPTSGGASVEQKSPNILLPTTPGGEP